MGEADDDVAGELAVYFEELAVVHDTIDNIVHIVRLVRVVGNDIVEHIVHAGNRVVGGHYGRLFHVVLRQVGQQLFDGGDAFLFGIGREMGHTALAGVHAGTAQGLLVHFLARDALRHGGTGQEHVGGVFDHQGKVRKGGGVHRTAGAGTEDSADLRDHTGGKDVALENLTIAGQGVDSLLDTGAARVVQTDAGGSVLEGHVHDLADLLGHGFGKGTAAHGEVLGENIHQTAVDGAAAGHHTVSVEMLFLHAEVGAAMLDEHVEFLETAFVEQQLQALTGSELAFSMLCVNPFLAAAHAGTGTPFHQLLDLFLLDAHILDLSKRGWFRRAILLFFSYY